MQARFRLHLVYWALLLSLITIHIVHWHYWRGACHGACSASQFRAADEQHRAFGNGNSAARQLHAGSALQQIQPGKTSASAVFRFDETVVEKRFLQQLRRTRRAQSTDASSSVSNTFEQTPEDERAALVEFYESTGGPRWLDSTN